LASKPPSLPLTNITPILQIQNRVIQLKSQRNDNNGHTKNGI
jgi:hypothetical protein